jgi:hypothetical protein
MNGRLWQVYACVAESGLLLRGDAREFDQLSLRVKEGVVFGRRDEEFDAVVSAVIRCPAGEPEAWVWIKLLSAPRKINASRPVGVRPGKKIGW